MTFVEIIAEIENKRVRGIKYIELLNLSDIDILNFYNMGFKVSRSRNYLGNATNSTKIEWK